MTKIKQRLSYVTILILFLFGGNTNIQAQDVEVKINPPLALFNILQTSVEFPIGPDFGIEAEGIFGDGVGGVVIHGKYYFRPDYGNDKIYIGLLTGGIFGDGVNGLAFGFEGGYKWFGKRNILFEIGLGIGRGTDEIDVVPYGKLMVGYRFTKKDEN